MRYEKPIIEIVITDEESVIRTSLDGEGKEDGGYGSVF